MNFSKSCLKNKISALNTVRNSIFEKVISHMKIYFIKSDSCVSTNRKCSNIMENCSENEVLGLEHCNS